MSAETDAAGPPADELGKEAKAPEPVSSPTGSDEKPGLGGKDRKSAAEDDSTAARESTEQLASLENHFHNTNIFNAPVDGSRATFGLAGGLNQDDTHRRTRTGRLPSEEAADVCRHFAAPPLYRDAAKALKRDRVVVLAGTSGLGKRTSAIRLLLDTGAEALEIVSPTLTLEDLSKHDFAAKHGYLVEDWQHAPRSEGASDYNWRLLRDHVIDSEVYLVITTATGRAGRSVTQFAWEAPTAEHVLKAHLADGEGLADEAAADAADEVVGKIPDTYPGRFSVGAVAALGRRLAAPGASFPEIVREIQQELSSDPGRYVREWLADEARTDDDFRRATALCFAAGRSERIFEVMLMRLESALRDSGLAEEEAGQNAKNGEDDAGQDAPAVRRGAGLGGLRTRRKANGLLEREGGKVRFQGREAPQQYLYHRYTVQELWRDFDMNFWTAIRDWLAELIGDTAIRDVQVSVAAGLAMLAFDALDEVEGSYLHPWADGEQAWSGQCTAVYVLWLMARDDSLSPVALRIATDWVNCGSPACQWTAAAALSGELGAAYPATAAARLWHLVGQWRDVPTKAVIALASLFATLTRVREGQEAYQVLTLLQERLSRARGQVEGAGGDGEGDRDSVRQVPSASWREDRRNRERAMLCILEVLAVRDPLTKHPSITSFLQGRPEHLGLVAELWAAVLVHRPYRKRALVALLDAVRGFDHVSDDPEGAARSLGDALTEALPAAEHPPLSADFLNIVARSRRPQGDATATVQALLRAFKHLEPTGRAAK